MIITWQHYGNSDKVFRMNHKAFTLIELLVVVAIIGILAAVGVVAYNGYTGAAKTAVIKSNHKFVVKQVNLILTSCEIEGSVQLMSKINNTDGEPDLVINFIAPVVPSPIEPPASTASAHLLPPIQPN